MHPESTPWTLVTKRATFFKVSLVFSFFVFFLRSNRKRGMTSWTGIRKHTVWDHHSPPLAEHHVAHATASMTYIEILIFYALAAPVNWLVVCKERVQLRGPANTTVLPVLCIHRI
jgi:hypothetical protein